MLTFALQAIWISVGLYYAYSTQVDFMAKVGSDIFTWTDAVKLLWIFPVFIIVPIFLIFVTYYKLYLPEKKNTTPSNASSWNLALAILGIFFGLILGVLPFVVAHGKIKVAEWESKWNPSSRQFS